MPYAFVSILEAAIVEPIALVASAVIIGVFGGVGGLDAGRPVGCKER